MKVGLKKPRVRGISNSEKCMILRQFVSKWYRLVMDGWTDSATCSHVVQQKLNVTLVFSHQRHSGKHSHTYNKNRKQRMPTVMTCQIQ